MKAGEPRGRFALASPRLLTSSPQTVLGYDSAQLREAVAMSEGRTVVGVARVRGPNACDGVSNAELCAAFGCDIVALGLYDPHNPYFPGLPNRISKEPDDTILAQVQADLGRGWTLREVRELIGRPIAAGLYGTKTGFPDKMEASFTKVLATPENALLLVEQGVDIVQVMDWLTPLPELAAALREIRAVIGNRALLSFARPNGWGLFGGHARREFITEEEIDAVIEAGCDIVEIPAVGTIPRFSAVLVERLVRRIHDGGALAGVWIATSQEGATTETIRQIAYDTKITGADMFTISDVGLTESVPDPENILALSIALRGRRHTYRRMAFSIRR
jgi:hypothetical protein